jgi:hypothetical protein
MTILQHEDWDPDELFAPCQHIVPPTKRFDDNVPYGIGRELIVDVPVDPRGTADVYIDDLVGLTVDLEDSGNDDRLSKALLLAMEVAGRPLQENEPIPRELMAAVTKLIAEVGLEESKSSWDGKSIFED